MLPLPQTSIRSTKKRKQKFLRMASVGNVLSLFDGMSCGQIALNRAGIKYEKYFASEIDKYAIQVTQHNFPDTIQLGDVTKVKAQDLPKIDLIIGGSPCQGFSFQGKGLNFKDERSKLFFEFVRLIKECEPKYFLLENVKMKYEHEIIISKYLGIEPLYINSDLVSAQNRERVYWTNIKAIPYNLFGDRMANISNIKDKGICVADITEKEVDMKYYLTQKKIDFILSRPKNYECKINPVKSNCLRTNYSNASANETYIQDERGIRKLTEIECERLQTVPDNYTINATQTQRYRMLGNGWTVDVIAHIFNHLHF